MTANVLGSYDDSSWCWHLKRNISMTPVQMASIFAGLSMVTLFIGAVFYKIGASFILPFSLLEIAALSLAFVYNAIHANDYEKLTLTESVVHIESKVGFDMQHIQLVRSLTRVDCAALKNELIELRQAHHTTYFGRFIHTNLRLLLAKQISDRMHSKLQNPRPLSEL